MGEKSGDGRGNYYGRKVAGYAGIKFKLNFLRCSKNSPACWQTRLEEILPACSGMALAHSRRPSMAGIRGVRRESPSR